MPEEFCPHGLPKRAACAQCMNLTMENGELIVFMLNCYSGGEYSHAHIFGTEEGCLAAAAKWIHEDLARDGFIGEIERTPIFNTDREEHDLNYVSPDDESEVAEFVDNMKELYQHEAYKDFVECWDTWIADGTFDSPPPRNFDIHRMRVE